MDFVHHFIDLILHLDKHITQLTASYGTGAYAILFAIIFCETGLVVTPFLPGDSLLFAAGAVASLGTLNVWVMAALLIVAAIAGDTVNYQIGRAIGQQVMRAQNPRFINKAHIERTHKFFERYGGMTIIFARFAPIVRTFAPFVAGAGAMTYARFLLFNVIGGVLWVSGFIGVGYAFGEVPVVKRNFTLIIFAIIVVSLMPSVLQYLKARRDAQGEQLSS